MKTLENAATVLFAVLFCFIMAAWVCVACVAPLAIFKFCIAYLAGV